MTRDYEAMRAILMTAANQSAATKLADMDVEAAALLADAGYLTVSNESTMRERRWWVVSATWKGHEAADSITQQGTWDRVMEASGARRGCRVPFELLIEAARHIEEAGVVRALSGDGRADAMEPVTVDRQPVQ